MNFLLYSIRQDIGQAIIAEEREDKEDRSIGSIFSRIEKLRLSQSIHLRTFSAFLNYCIYFIDEEKTCYDRLRKGELSLFFNEGIEVVDSHLKKTYAENSGNVPKPKLKSLPRRKPLFAPIVSDLPIPSPAPIHSLQTELEQTELEQTGVEQTQGRQATAPLEKEGDKLNKNSCENSRENSKENSTRFMEKKRAFHYLADPLQDLPEERLPFWERVFRDC